MSSCFFGTILSLIPLAVSFIIRTAFIMKKEKYQIELVEKLLL